MNSELDGEIAEEVKYLIASEFDEYLADENFLKLPIDWLIDITKKPEIENESILKLIQKMIDTGNEMAIVLLNSLKIKNDENVDKLFDIIKNVQGRLFVCCARQLL